MTSANEIQVGGSHYKGSQYQHWDFVLNTHQDYLVGNATKYISRSRKKNGVEDLKKALHYIDKLTEVFSTGGNVSPATATNRYSRLCEEEVHAFCVANSLGGTERAAIGVLCLWQDAVDLERARGLVRQLIDEAEPKPVPLTEENHHTERTSIAD